jgi:hypothetical protein
MPPGSNRKTLAISRKNPPSLLTDDANREAGQREIAGPGQCEGPGGDSCGGTTFGGGGGIDDANGFLPYAWDASTGYGGTDPSGDCPICTGPYGSFGRAGIAQGYINVVTNPGGWTNPGLPASAFQFSTRSDPTMPTPSLLAPGESADFSPNDDPLGDTLNSTEFTLLAQNGVLGAANNNIQTNPFRQPTNSGKTNPNLVPGTQCSAGCHPEPFTPHGANCKDLALFGFVMGVVGGPWAEGPSAYFFYGVGVASSGGYPQC